MKLLFPILLLSSVAFGQQAQKFTFPKSATTTVSQITEDYSPALQNLEAPAPGGENYREHLLEIKQNLPAPTGEPLTTFRSAEPPPLKVSGFNGNSYDNRVPNDNDMAISNGGKIVSVINSNISVFEAATGQKLLNVSLQAFSDSLGIPDDKFDPRVMYDPLEDRFIIVFLRGFDDSSSYIVVAFSQTNDPAGAWNLYALAGNPNLDTTWTDFPMLGLTQDELFITGNSIINDSSWQVGFTRTLLWQINKHDGFAGDSLRTMLWDSIFYGGRPIRNLCPAKGGNTPYGPDQWFISNRNFDVTNDTFFLVHLSDTINGNPQLTVQVIKADVEYGVPPVARQTSNHTFETNDGRVLSAFYENDRIHFAGNCRVPSTGFAGIYHGILTDPDGTPAIHGNIIGDTALDFGYPNIVYTGNVPFDEAFIVCDHSSPDTFAGMSAFFYREGNYSGRTSIRTGDSYVNILSGTYERWGDYTGAQRLYSDTNVIWVSGNYGRWVGSALFKRQNATWIAELRTGGWPTVVPEPQQEAMPTPYPNPFAEFFSIRFINPSTQLLDFRLYDLQGREVKWLLRDRVKAGENEFSFSTGPLAAGHYLLKIEGSTVNIASTTVIKN